MFKKKEASDSFGQNCGRAPHLRGYELKLVEKALGICRCSNCVHCSLEKKLIIGNTLCVTASACANTKMFQLNCPTLKLH